jgi:murein DD-endopeptidase MepM/ murein hydrolase activator NlpD
LETIKMQLRAATCFCVGLCLALSFAMAASARSQTAALEAALRAGEFYAGPQSHARVAVAVGGRGLLGRRVLRRNDAGPDVADLQLALAWQGFPSGRIDGRFGPQLTSSLTRFQQSTGIRPDGIAGAATIAALRRQPAGSPIPLVWPLLAPVGDGFGPRGDRFHAGIDLIAPAGTDVIAAAPGLVTWAGERTGGWGKLVTVAHGRGVRTMYAHLSTIDVKVGEWISGGTVLGRVGATGDATGPHLHFEVRVNGAAIDPLRALVTLVPTPG